MARGRSGARDGGGPGMRRGRNHQAEGWAVLRVNNVVVDELKWHFGTNALPDFGVDVLTEVVAADDWVTGLLIGIQVKGGDSWFSEPKGDLGWVFRSDDDHLAYWLGYSLPVIVVLVNDKREAFWQAITPETVTETKARFSVVPRAQRFDRSALEPLLALARKSGGLLGALPEHCAVLPASAVHPLRRAEGTDHLAAARLAERLASGRDHPDLTVSSLVAMQPTWIMRSAAAQDLWLAAGAYAEQYGHRGVVGSAFAEAAQADGPQAALASAAAGIALLFADRAAAREHLLRARKGGQVMLAEIGLSTLDVPDGQLIPAVIPPSVSGASAEELDKQPNVLSFLANNAARSGDLNAAVAFSERAVASAGDQDSALRLELARFIHSRAVSGDMSPREIRRAVQHAQAVMDADGVCPASAMAGGHFRRPLSHDPRSHSGSSPPWRAGGYGVRYAEELLPGVTITRRAVQAWRWLCNGPAVRGPPDPDASVKFKVLARPAVIVAVWVLEVYPLAEAVYWWLPVSVTNRS